MFDPSESALFSDAPAGLAALALALQQRDEPTHWHCLRTAGLVDGFARSLGIEEDDCRCLQLAAYLHDLGKIGVPDRVLQKDGRLDADEWPLMRVHAEHGAVLLRRLQLPRGELMAEWVLCHHERFDGSGYPQALAGSDIPWGARLIAVADTYDAITQGRPYRPAEERARAVQIIEAEAGRSFDPDLVKLFLRFLRD